MAKRLEHRSVQQNHADDHNDPKRNPQIFDNFSVLSFEKHAKFI